jgi:hypothetical protein
MFNLSVLHVWFKTWMESPCMFSLSVLHVWFKTFRWNLPLCSICKYFMSGPKLLDWITPYVQLVSTSCLVQNFWMESPCMFNLSILHVLFKTFGLNHPVFSVFHVWFKRIGLNHPVCLICQFFMSGSKLLYWIILYMQLVSTSCLIQNFWIESSCMFNLSVLHIWFKTFRWNHPVCSNFLFFMSGSKLLDGNTTYVQLVWFKNFGLNHPVCLIYQFFMYV